MYFDILHVYYIMYFVAPESPLTPIESEISDEDVSLESGLNLPKPNANRGTYMLLNIVNLSYIVASVNCQLLTSTYYGPL